MSVVFIQNNLNTTGGETLLVVSDGSHAHASDAISLTQAHTLAVGEAAHSHSSEAPTLAQAHTLSVSDAAHGHAADGIDLTQAHTLVVSDAAHDHAADNITLDMGVTLSVEDGTHDHAADELALVSNGIAEPKVGGGVYLWSERKTKTKTKAKAVTLAVGRASHAMKSDTPLLVRDFLLAVDVGTMAMKLRQSPVDLSQEYRVLSDDDLICVFAAAQEEEVLV